MSRYLVTGGCGFIGSHLVDALVSSGHFVRVLDDLSTGTTNWLSPGTEFLHGSVADADLVARAVSGIDGCFHLAAIASVQRSIEDLVSTSRINLGGTLCLLEAVIRRGPPIHCVYASSAAVYGDCPSIPIGEGAPKHPQSPYGADKYASELHAAVANNSSGLTSTGLRFFNVYGPRQPPNSPYSGVVSIFADRLTRGLPLTVFGDGGQTRDFIQVADVVAALRAAMELQLPGATVFNVCTGRGASVLDLAGVVAGLLGKPATLIHGPARAGEIRHSVGDPAAGRTALGLGEPIPLEQGLRSVLGG